MLPQASFTVNVFFTVQLQFVPVVSNVLSTVMTPEQSLNRAFTCAFV